MYERRTKENEVFMENESTGNNRRESIAYLQGADLAQRIVEDLSWLGCVGENANKLLGYIVTVSRKLDNPLSMIIQSQSGSGKSHLADVLESIIPPEDCLHLSRITPQALYYMKKDTLRNRVLLIEEKEGAAGADYSLRVLQSKQRLTLLVPSKDKGGRISSKTIEVEGPTTTIETSTRHDLNPENTSRCFLLYLDESEEQTMRIHAYQKHLKTMQGRQLMREREDLRIKHHNIQRMLRSMPVHIPYVDKISFPTRGVRARRDFFKFLNLIEAIAFLHQYQRRIIKDEYGQEYVESDIRDYRIAFGICGHIFRETLSELGKNDQTLLEAIKRMDKRIFTRRDVREYTRLPDHQVRMSLKALIDYECLHVKRGCNGVKFEYALNGASLDEGEITNGLLSPEDLAKTLRRPCSKVNSKRMNQLNQP